MNLTSFLLVLLLEFVTAKVSAKVSYWNDPNKTNSNRIDDESEFNEWDSCAMKPFPSKPETMCCGVDVTSSNRIVGGEPTALNQYPWMALIEYQYINRKVRGLRCGGSLISSRYVLIAAHCVAGKILKESIPVTVVLGDYDKFHNGPDCVISNGRKICTEGELRIPINNIKVHPEYDTTISSNDIAVIQMSKMAPYTDSIRPLCLPSGDLTKHFQENLWLDIAGWGTMKQEKVGDIFKSNTSAVKRHLRVPFVPTKKCQTIWPQVNSKQMCAGGLNGKDACMGDSGGPLMLNNRGQFEVSGVVSFGHAKPCGRKGVPTVYTNVHEYISWIFNQIEKMERLIYTKSTRFTSKHVPQTPLTVNIVSKGIGLKKLVETTMTKTQNGSTREKTEETKTRLTQDNTPERNIKGSIMTPREQSAPKGKSEEETVVVVPRPHISPNGNIPRTSEETTPPHYTSPKENIYNRFQYKTSPRQTNVRRFRNYDPLHLRSIQPQMRVHNLHPSRDYQFKSDWQKTF